MRFSDALEGTIYTVPVHVPCLTRHPAAHLRAPQPLMHQIPCPRAFVLACRYQVQFVPNRERKAIFDRRFNTATLLGMYYPSVDFSQRIVWNPDDPNVLSLSVPG